jgi:DNA invertase Pin-like site-specific DNA recombinase
MRLVAYVRVSREDERLENQGYAVYRWATERGHQIEDVEGRGSFGGVTAW